MITFIVRIGYVYIAHLNSFFISLSHTLLTPSLGFLLFAKKTISLIPNIYLFFLNYLYLYRSLYISFI